MIINHNMSSLFANNAVNKVDSSIQKSIEKLSTGQRINRASDDAAGLAISEKMRSQIKGMDVAKKNTMDGISMVQTAEASLGEVQDMLQRMRELAVQASNGTYSSADAANLQMENSELVSQISDIAGKTKFNGIDLISSGASNITIQTGANNGDTLTITAQKADTTTLGIDSLDISTVGGANSAIDALDTAIDTVSTSRAQLGAYQNRLEHVQSNLTSMSANMVEAESRVRDVDMAQEMAEYSKKNILMQAGVSMAAQANQKTSLVQRLLQ